MGVQQVNNGNQEQINVRPPENQQRVNAEAEKVRENSNRIVEQSNQNRDTVNISSEARNAAAVQNASQRVTIYSADSQTIKTRTTDSAGNSVDTQA